MSDYLTNLAARSLEAVATIRPRLPSFYEAPQRGFALPAEPAAENGEEPNDVVAIAAPSKRAVITTEPLDTVVARDTVVVRDDVRPSTAPITAAVVNDETSATPVPAPPPPGRTVDRIAETAPVLSPPVPPIVDAVISETPRVSRERRQVPVAAAEPDRAVEGASDPKTERPALIARSPQRPRAQPEPPAFSVRPHQEPTRSFDDTDPAGSASSRERLADPNTPRRTPSPIRATNRITPSRIVSESQAAPRTEPAVRPPRIRHQSPPTPDVHVTIGRVEVRALPTAEPPSRGRSTAPSDLMNLDDYLRRRDGKGRR